MNFDKLIDAATRICVKTFAEPGGFVLVPAGGGEPRLFPAVFDCNYQVVTVDGGVEMASRHPALKCNANDVESVEEGDRIIHQRSGERYLVVDIQPDSGHGVVLILHKDN